MEIKYMLDLSSDPYTVHTNEYQTIDHQKEKEYSEK